MRNFILYGFSEEEINKIKNTIKFISSSIEYLTVCNDDFDKTLKDIIDEKKFIIEDSYSLDEKIIIFNNIYPKEIDVYLKLLKKKVNRKIIFATTTENSLSMTIRDLFSEFLEERNYFNK